MTLLQILMSYKVPSKLKSLWPNRIIRSLLMRNVSPLLISKQVTKWPSKKLSEKYFKPYEIISQPSTLLSTLYFPESMCSVHPDFHISILEPAMSNVMILNPQGWIKQLLYQRNTRELDKELFTKQSTLYTPTDGLCQLLCTLP